MKSVEHLIIGGGVAGTTCAETIRQLDTACSVAIVSDEPYRLYSRIMLSKPNFFLEKIPFDQVWLKTEAWYKEKNIELIAGKIATKLDATKKEVTLSDGTIIGYKKLLLAIGGVVREWNVPVPKSGVHYLRTLDHAKGVIENVKTAKQAISVGGGFISFEMCEMMRMAGLDVTLMLRESHYWEPLLDEASGRIIERALEKGGVHILRNAEVAQVLGADAVEGVVLKDGTHLPCQMIIAGIGLVCPTGWLKDAGVAVGRGILANEYLETNIPDVWAAGDGAEFHDVILGEQIQLGNWVNAQMHGRTAAMNMMGKHIEYKLVSFYTTQGFGIGIAFVGDVRPAADRTIVTRGLADSGAYGRILIKDGEIIGATLINRTNELGLLAKLIEKDVKMSGREGDLGNPAFDLKTLIP
ncbi:MAG: FAD-dependent oxidoreductase [Patescibacteria group bacterium]